MDSRITKAEFASTSYISTPMSERQTQRMNALQAHDDALVGRVRQAFGKLLRAVAEYPRRRRVFDELAMLSDRELMDIGLTRGDIPSIFEERFEDRLEARRPRAAMAEVANAQDNVPAPKRSLAA
jgi:uncharacterized protein YjiS (DUF1127 family)